MISTRFNHTTLAWLVQSASKFFFFISRQIAHYNIVEREDGVTMEESAGTISSMEAFNPKTKKLW